MEFKDRLKQYRLDNNLTQDELADKLFVSRQAISKYETGRGYPSIDVLTELAKLMNISVDELLTREELVNETQRMTETLHRNKKKTVILVACIVLATIISAVTVLLSTTGIIAYFNTYKVPANHCIVGLFDDYQLYSDSEGELCTPIDKNIKGIDKTAYENWGLNFYSVVKGEEYTIIVDDMLADYNGYDGVDVGIYGDYWLTAYWQGNIIAGLEKTYSEESGLEDELFFETNYNQVVGHVKVIFTENCTVRPVFEPYLYVGGIFQTREKGSDLLNQEIHNYIDEYGNINETDGYYYLLLNGEICIHQDAWKTNLEVTDYKYEYVDGIGGKCIQAQFTAKQPVVGENEEWCLYTICRTLTGKYFVYPNVFIGPIGFNMPIRENKLKLSLE